MVDIIKKDGGKIIKIIKHSNYPIVGHLPQGAPTSPMLANLVCIQLDKELQNIASRENLIFTRYADDIIFSGLFTTKAKLIHISKEVSKHVSKFGFGINVQKTCITHRGAREIVTGLSINGNTLHVPRIYKDKVKQELYFLEKYGLYEHCDGIQAKNPLAYLRRLKGRILYIHSIEKSLGIRYLDKFNQILPYFKKIEKILSDTNSHD